MNYYVVSPNAANDDHVDKYLSYMKRHHVVFMGWDTSHKSGNIFSQIQPGDCILVARRQNWEWKSFFAGIADSVSAYDEESGEKFEQRIELRQFVDFKDCGNVIPFMEGCTSYKRQIPGAIFQLDTNNQFDVNIIRLLDFFTCRSSRVCTLREIARWQDNHRVSIPALQRGLVWAPQQVELLWDSLLRGFPIGSFAISASLENPEQNTENAGTEYFLMDGQQRYNAIALGYHTPNPQSQATLWLDFCPPKSHSSSRRFWFKTTTSAHPWGVANNDECSVLGWKRYREALANFVPDETDISKIKIQELHLVDTWPIESGCPVPLPIVMNCYSRSSSDWDAAQERFKQLLEEWLENFKEKHQKFLPKSINCKVLSQIFKALEQLQSYTVSVDVLKNQILDDADHSSPDEKSSIEHLFTRLNTMGTPVSSCDLRSAGRQMSPVDQIRGLYFCEHAATFNRLLDFSKEYEAPANGGNAPQGESFADILKNEAGITPGKGTDNSMPQAEENRGILSPEIFLLHVLSLFLRQDGIMLDENKILQTFKSSFTRENAGNFIEEAERYRTWLDANIIYLRYAADGTLEYRLRREDEETETNPVMKQLQSMLYVSSSDQQKWVLDAYVANVPLTTKELEKQITGNENIPDLNEMTYGNIDRYWFWKLDYVLWKKFMKNGDDPLFSGLLPDEKAAIRNYSFRRNRSIEHLHPQTDADAWEERAKHQFGNLAMISSSFNSVQQKDTIGVKFARLQDTQIPHKSLESIKMLLMFVAAGRQESGWTPKTAQEHGNAMYHLLKDYHNTVMNETL